MDSTESQYHDLSKGYKYVLHTVRSVHQYYIQCNIVMEQFISCAPDRTPLFCHRQW